MKLQRPNSSVFAPFGAFLEPPTEVGDRSIFSEWLKPVPGLSHQCHLNRVAPSTFPLTVDQVECHPHAASLTQQHRPAEDAEFKGGPGGPTSRRNVPSGARGYLMLLPFFYSTAGCEHHAPIIGARHALYAPLASRMLPRRVRRCMSCPPHASASKP